MHRLARNGCAALVACVVIVCAVAQSNPPAPAPAKAADNYQTKSNGVEGNTHPDAKATKALESSVDKLVLEIDQKDKSDESSKSQSDTPSQWWTIIPTLVIAGAAIAQAIIYWKQAELMKGSLVETRKSADAAKESADATKASVTAMKDTAERQLRAYLGIDTRTSDKNTDAPFPFGIPIINGGPTPAYDVEFLGDWAFFPGKETRWPENKSFEPRAKAGLSKGTIMPNCPTIMRYNEFIDAADGTTHEEAKQKAHLYEVTLYYFGVIRYVDAFKNPQTTEFCVRLNPKTGRGVVYDRHNAST